MFLTFPKWKWISLVILALSAGWIALSTQLIPPPVATSISAPQIGLLAPSITLPSLQNGEQNVHLSKGKVVLVNFFASWCPPCKAEMPALQKTYSKYQPDGLEIFAITNLQQDNLTDTQMFIKAAGARFPVLLDQDGTVFREYAIRALPTTFLIDSSGRIRKIFYGGPLTEGLLATEIERALKDQ
jgi:cytochrome c biogenesis protein CcmG/thiol:disulfide interchange protein DsbE